MKLTLRAAACCLGFANACKWDPREEPYSHYASFSEALTDDAVQRGVLPEWVPSSAFEIHVQVNLDTNRQCLRFGLPPSDGEKLRGQLASMSPGEIDDLDAGCSFNPDWWFDGLIQQQPANDAALYADIYRAPDSRSGKPVAVAIDHSGALVYVWTPYNSKRTSPESSR